MNTGQRANILRNNKGTPGAESPVAISSRSIIDNANNVIHEPDAIAAISSTNATNYRGSQGIKVRDAITGTYSYLQIHDGVLTLVETTQAA